MAHWQGKRKLAVVTACVSADGTPDFALTEVEVTFEDYEEGVHYDLVEERLKGDGFEEPFVHFDEDEAPDFLLPAVRRYVETVEGPSPDHEISQEEP